MRELSLHILDIVQNSIKAGADTVKIAICENRADDWLSIIIEDNGCGMNSEVLQNVLNPFYTSRTTRKVGLGLPLFKQAAENAGGGLSISSEVGRGTTVEARFRHGHIDRQPLGNMAETMLGLITAYNDVNFVYRHTLDETVFEFDTGEMKKLLGGIPLNSPEVFMWLQEFLGEGEGSLL